MKLFRALIPIFSIALFISCGNKNATPTKDNADSPYAYYGDEITDDGTITMDAALGNLQTQDTISTKMKATVGAVCQTKGCWMTLTQEGSDQEIFVKFKDYGFFVPKDIAGKEVIVSGKAYKEVTTVDELRHYAEDEGKSQEEILAITEEVEELKFMADGVILIK